MAVHTLKENYRASKAVLDYVNNHNPSVPGTLIQCDTTNNPGLVCPTDANPPCPGLADAASVAAQALSSINANESVALLCRTNNQVRQWQAFLENWEDPKKSNNFPLKNKTRLIQDDGVKVHRLWPVWWFFHGYQHLHPVPTGQFHDWCKKLGLVDCKKAGGCTCAGHLQESVDFPKKDPSSTTATYRIKTAAAGCPKRQEINGRIADDTPLLFKDAFDQLQKEICHTTESNQTIANWFTSSSCKDYRAEYKDQWDQMLKDLDADFPPESKVTWADLWYWFEEYCDEMENHLPKDKIILSTIHKSKGCEFDTVFLWDWENRETEKKLYYVACSRPRKNLYILKPSLEVRPATGDLVKQLATPDQVTNIFPLANAFGYKDKQKKDYSIVLQNICAPWMLTNWGSIVTGTHPATPIAHNEHLHVSLRGEQRKHYHASGNAFAVYFQGSDHGDIPLILPVIEPTLLIVTKQKKTVTSIIQQKSIR